MSTVNTTDNEPDLIDIDGLAARLGVTERFVRGLIENHVIPYHKVGKLVRFRPDDISAWLDETRVDPRVGR